MPSVFSLKSSLAVFAGAAAVCWPDSINSCIYDDISHRCMYMHPRLSMHARGRPFPQVGQLSGAIAIYPLRERWRLHLLRTSVTWQLNHVLRSVLQQDMCMQGSNLLGYVIYLPCPVFAICKLTTYLRVPRNVVSAYYLTLFVQIMWTKYLYFRLRQRSWISRSAYLIEYL